MAINASDWFDSFDVEWAEDGLGFLADSAWRMKIVDGGVLVFGQKQASESFMVVAPHTWKSVKTPSFYPKAVNSSDWNDDAKVVPPSSNYGRRMKLMDGGMLLFQSQDGGFVVVAPHAWTTIHTSVDFTKRHPSKPNKTATR
jgi:hypothetical protein